MATDATATTASQVRSPKKWAALVDDQVVWSPQKHVAPQVLKDQAGVGNDRILVRDHNSPHDVVLKDDKVIDLGAGNVFYTLDKNDIRARDECTAPPKLAFFVDDRPEITTRSDQTGKMLRALFNIPSNVKLIRDAEGPEDDEIGADTPISFLDGCVFYTRKVEHLLEIIVNARTFTERDGVMSHMTGMQIATLVYPDKPGDTTVHFVSAGGREVGLAETVHIKGAEVFDVVRKNVTGGFEEARVNKEIQLLAAAGQTVTLLMEPFPAVIYRGLRTKNPNMKTDVLVAIPSAYPAQMLDGAYLPEGSGLLGRVKGQIQQRVVADGHGWHLISYHPHNGGGGPAWNPGVHGLNTYVGEILSWLYDAQ